MTHYLTHLTNRVLNPGDSLQPRLGSRFEPLPQGLSALTPTEAETHLSPEAADLEGVVANPVMPASFRPSEHLEVEAEGLGAIAPPSPRPPHPPAPVISLGISPPVPVDADHLPRPFAAPTPLLSPPPMLSPPPQATPPRLPQGRLDGETDPVAPRLAPRPLAPLPSAAESAARAPSEPGLPGDGRSLPNPSPISPELSVRQPLVPKLRPQVLVKLPIIAPALSSPARVSGPSEMPQSKGRPSIGSAEQGATKTGEGTTRLNSPQPSPPIQSQNPSPQLGLTGILSATAPPRVEQSKPLGAPQEVSRGSMVPEAAATSALGAAPQPMPPTALSPMSTRANRRTAQTLQPHVEPLPSLPIEMATQPERTTVNISIGRIEVRAVPPHRATPRTARVPVAPVTSLSTYLHSGGQR